MLYRAIGLMSGSSLDGLDIVYAQYEEISGNWSYEIQHMACYEYSPDWALRLKNATSLSAPDYLLLHTSFGHYIGEQVNHFIEKNNLHYKVQLIASHGHTSFHMPENKMTAQLGDGAAIAAVTGINVISDLRSMDIAFGGQGAPIIPIGEKLLLKPYQLFLNLGGIANISLNAEKYIAFDVCPANRVLNLLSQEIGMEYDDNGDIALSGAVDDQLLNRLNQFDYYQRPYPKSLANEFGTELLFPVIKESGCTIPDALRTYTEHIAIQINRAIAELTSQYTSSSPLQLLCTGGGAHNNFLVSILRTLLSDKNIHIEVPAKELVDFKEALVMGLIGVLRWREENNVLSSVTGAVKDSIGGAVWIGAGN